MGRVDEALRQHLVEAVKKHGGSMPAAQCPKLYANNEEFAGAVKDAGGFKKFVVKGGGPLEFLEGGKGGCDMVRLTTAEWGGAVPGHPVKVAGAKAERVGGDPKKLCPFDEVPAHNPAPNPQHLHASAARSRCVCKVEQRYSSASIVSCRLEAASMAPRARICIRAGQGRTPLRKREPCADNSRCVLFLSFHLAT